MTPMMTNAERDLLMALAKAVLIGTRPPPDDYASADQLSQAFHFIRKAREEVIREMAAGYTGAADGTASSSEG
jgi:hypothetical protein